LLLVITLFIMGRIKKNRRSLQSLKSVSILESNLA
jgi:hypothetical protein